MMALLSVFIVLQIPEYDSSLFSLDTLYTRYQAVQTDSIPRESLFTPTPTDTLHLGGEELRISGTKDFSFDIDQGFNQGLKVDISGKIEDINIEGSLSDKATASSTIQLSEVDKMKLSVYTTHFYGALGNLALNLPFGIYDEIQGARIGIRNKDNTHVYGTYAVERGKYYRMQFIGEEGKQSPYFLDGIVVPGTERVYLSQGGSQSSLLTRDIDYTLDYETSILSFSNNQVITNHTRFEVEYEQAINDYPRIYVEGDANLALTDYLFKGMYLRTSDDLANPYTFTLDQSEREQLRLSGDSMTVLYTHADTSSHGAYILQDSHFVYVGEENGDYDVSFFYVGENNGEYVYDPLVKGFSFRGPGLGNYSPTTYLPLPECLDFFGIGLKAYRCIEMELYGSSHDLNTHSPLDDYDNLGTGFRGQFDKSLNILSLSADYRYYSERLTMPQGKEMIDYRYRWNTDEALEEMGNISVSLQPFTMLSLTGGYGMLNRSHRRHHVTVCPFFFQLGYEAVDSVARYHAGCAKKWSFFDLNARYDYTKSTHLFRYTTIFTIRKTLSLGIEGGYDQDTLSRGITTIGSVRTPPISLSIGHRMYDDTSHFFGSAHINLHLKELSLIGNLEHTQRYSQKRDETYTKVDKGTGNYIFDPVTGSYIEMEGGDYIKKIFLLQEFQRTFTRICNLETRYSHSPADILGRLSLTDEEDFFSVTSDLDVLIAIGPCNLNMLVGQTKTNDNRYALYESSRHERYYGTGVSGARFMCRGDVRESIERYNDFIKEKRNQYATEASYDVLVNPLLRPLAGYTYAELFSSYYLGQDISLYSPKTSMLLGIPFNKRGRIELSGELIHHSYSVDEVPYLYSAKDPPGLSKNIYLTARFGMSAHTVISLVYRISFPPGQEFTHTLRFLTQIRF